LRNRPGNQHSFATIGSHADPRTFLVLSHGLCGSRCIPKIPSGRQTQGPLDTSSFETSSLLSFTSDVALPFLDAGLNGLRAELPAGLPNGGGGGDLRCAPATNPL